MNKDINRREFLKIVGITAATSTVALAGCGKNENATRKPGQGGTHEGLMTLRTNNKTGDRVSLLGYGMMRLPTVPSPTAKATPWINRR